MEKTVRIINQSALQTKEYTDEKSGEKKVLNSVAFVLTDGIDTFVAEITGERAVNCPKYDPMYQYRVQCTMSVREWESAKDGALKRATGIRIERINMI